jgi:hypothetical protein
MQLMNQFLFMHPSFKRTVEFVSEIVFSSYVKSFRQTELKKELNDFMECYFNQNNQDMATDEMNQREIIDLSELENSIKNLLHYFSKNCAIRCVDSSKSFFIAKIDVLVDNLLEKSESNQMIVQTKQITLFKAIEKLKQWVSINLSEQIFFEELKIRRFKKRNDLHSQQNQTDLPAEKCITDDLSFEKPPVFEQNQMMPSELFNMIKVGEAL